MTQIFRFLGISPFLTLHSTCCVRSPLIPKFKALSGLKNLDHTVWYLDKPFIIESRWGALETRWETRWGALETRWETRWGALEKTR